jgi:hypothetical protein
MQFLAAAAIFIAAVVGTIVAVLAVLAMRQGWREGSTVELLGADGMPLANPSEPGAGRVTLTTSLATLTNNRQPGEKHKARGAGQ